MDVEKGCSGEFEKGVTIFSPEYNSPAVPEVLRTVSVSKFIFIDIQRSPSSNSTHYQLTAKYSILIVY